MEDMKSLYANRTINPDYYTTIKITGLSELKALTKEEFKNDERGYVWVDNKTGKLVLDK